MKKILKGVIDLTRFVREILFSELDPTTKLHKRKWKMMIFIHGVFMPRSILINSRHLKYFLSGHKLIFHDLMRLLLEQGIPGKYKEIGVMPNSNCDYRVINPKGCIQDCISKCCLNLIK